MGKKLILSLEHNGKMEMSLKRKLMATASTEVSLSWAPQVLIVHQPDLN